MQRLSGQGVSWQKGIDLESLRIMIKKYGHWLAALLIFVLIVAGIGCYREFRKETYRIVCLGDSIIGNERGPDSITGVMEELLGETVYNGAFGGSTMCRRVTEDSGSVTTDTLSMAKLSEAISQQDFYVQNASVTRCAVMEYFPEAVYGFQTIDFDETEILVIEHGVNDYLTGSVLDNPDDPFDTYTFGGALRYSLENLKAAYPELRIILVTPTYCWFLALESNCEEIDRGNGILEDYVKLELEIAAQYGVEVLDNYHESGIGDSKTFEEWEVYTQDGLHLNEVGRRLVAERIIEQINQ